MNDQIARLPMALKAHSHCWAIETLMYQVQHTYYHLHFYHGISYNWIPFDLIRLSHQATKQVTCSMFYARGFNLFVSEHAGLKSHLII